jgi:hypothetical protein
MCPGSNTKTAFRTVFIACGTYLIEGTRPMIVKLGQSRALVSMDHIGRLHWSRDEHALSATDTLRDPAQFVFADRSTDNPAEVAEESRF